MRKHLINLINVIFHFENIDGGSLDGYLHRWGLFGREFSKGALGGRNLYLHHFIGDDYARELHDHPKWFITIGIWGSYVEETPSGSQVYKAPWIRRFKKEHIHRLKLACPGLTCWTLVLTGRAEDDWGFYCKQGWVRWDKYIFRGDRGE